jgi:hypothetical protein
MTRHRDRQQRRVDAVTASTKRGGDPGGPTDDRRDLRPMNSQDTLGAALEAFIHERESCGMLDGKRRGAHERIGVKRASFTARRARFYLILVTIRGYGVLPSLRRFSAEVTFWTSRAPRRTRSRLPN